MSYQITTVSTEEGNSYRAISTRVPLHVARHAAYDDNAYFARKGENFVSYVENTNPAKRALAIKL